MALVLRRRPGESIVLYTSDGEIRIDTLKDWGSLMFYITAPKAVKVLREELVERETTR